MKKMFIFLVGLFTAVILSACSTSKAGELEGKYYSISDVDASLAMTITAEGGGSIGRFAITEVDPEKGQVTFSSDLGEVTRNLEYKDGKVKDPIYEYDIYKKGTKAFDKAMKKYGYTEKDLTD
ncbi:hypothetical protein BBG03_03310 [Streptococcus dysgalactiae subsp. equisimilis]|uniref:hypothetical protein n=1 Tax=Streptococcus dysgalactiae TaxID=1334 RepID=UPI0008071384|nr:hypothetical protein [Streptococcus dysgalactiae]OBZ00623.1 hypothetical protein BBG03_03310 [Streptococcus dysgalactiae subsp. equisimilis]